MNSSLAALALALLAVIGGHLLDGGDLGTLLHGTALLIVVGGTASALLLQTPAAVLRRGLAQARCLREDAGPAAEPLIQCVTDYSRMSRADGFLSLEAVAEVEPEPFRRRALEMLVDGVDAEELQRTLMADVEAFESRERQAARIWESAGACAPTMGILGAVMGLIQVMQNLSEPAALGHGIAVAFVSTLYGVALANLFLLPLANRIKARIVDEVRLRRMLIEGFAAVAAGANPRLVERRMRSHLAPDRAA
ncbi:MAG: flagellar motor protein [Rhodocyclaceae bacterium]|nr:flagellar motor protein [Rhodocyclaceae bacterium]